MEKTRKFSTAGQRPKTIPLAKIRLDGDTQSRVELSDEVIKDYRLLMESGKEFPPLLVAFDGSDYWLIDGFHRRWAAVKAKRDKIRCLVVEGTREDARWLSYGSNIDHGLPRTNEDKRKAVIAAFKHPRGAKMSDMAVAQHCGVDGKTAAKYRPTSEVPKSERTGRDGRTTNTANCGKKSKCEHAQDATGPNGKCPEGRGKPRSQSDEPSNGPPDAPEPEQEAPAAPRETTRTEPAEKPESPDRNALGWLREVFDYMTPTERLLGQTAWADWLDD